MEIKNDKPGKPVAGRVAEEPVDTSGLSSRRRRQVVLQIAAGAAAAGVQAGSWAQSPFPHKPIRAIVPFPAGGGTDAVVRAISDRLSVELGQPLVIDNKPGAATIIGATAGAKAAPDGYTVLIATTTTMINNAGMYKKLPYDPVKDFEPITLVSLTSTVFVCPVDAPYGNLKEFVAWAKAQKRPISYGSWGKGSPAHLVGELLRTRYGLPMLHIPYKGGMTALTDVRSGVLDTSFSVPANVRTLVQAKELKALGVTGPQRSSGLPQIATFGEQGFPGFELAPYVAVYVPAGTPRPIVERLSKAFAAAIRTPAVSKQLIDQGQEPFASTPEELNKLYLRDAPQWLALMKLAGIEPE